MANDPGTWDVLVAGGTVVDGTGRPGRLADVAIRADRIVRIAPPGRMDPALALDIIDASGLVVAPGFVDLNGQSDWLYLSDGSAGAKLFQGITTEIMGESTTPAPVGRNVPLAQSAGAETDARRREEWRSFGAWLEEMEASGVALNVGSFVGGTTVRRHGMGMAEGTPDRAAMDTMRAVTARAMEDGAFGIATALIYPPGSWATTEELEELAGVVAGYGGLYVTHLRSESDFMEEALEEAFRIGARSGAPVEILHLKVAGRQNWPRTESLLQSLDSVRASGLDVGATLYPYTAASTGLTACFPPWVQADGALYRNLADPAARDRIRAEMTGPPGRWENWCRLATPEGSRIATVSNPDHVRWVGSSLAEVAEERGVHWTEAAMDLVLRDRSRVGMIYEAMSEDGVRQKLALDWVRFGTDGAGFNPRAGGGRIHPRAYGSMPRILGHYVREEGVLTLEEAVRRGAGSAAHRIGLRDRGILRPGYHADVIVFDPQAVEERATWERPHQVGAGMHHVFVNGVAVIRDGEETGARPGRFVRGPGTTER
ncbi:MAG: D-aminoacylase [Gemmatimonadales bacterium]|nr:MAG: D-aminoacylase [Gemmatimonadales bacterium]